MTRKLRLELDDLAVESFDAGDGRAEQRGTVQGHVSARVVCPENPSLPIGQCSTRCDTTTATNDTFVDCSESCDTEIECSNGTCP